jgi:UDP-N-acetyl-D-mannosaminuronate dehydrogenase
VAEAAKVIENTQRDVNIALINELALIFNRMGIDTEDVLKQQAQNGIFTVSPRSSWWSLYRC